MSLSLFSRTDILLIYSTEYIIYKLNVYYSKRGYILHDRDYQAILFFDQLDDDFDGLDDELDVH
jgi:hypothetical protein